jgi:hypothetical protein
MSHGDEPTRFAESNALLAVHQGETQHALGILSDSTDAELTELAAAGHTLYLMCVEMLAARRRGTASRPTL